MVRSFACRDAVRRWLRFALAAFTSLAGLGLIPRLASAQIFLNGEQQPTQGSFTLKKEDTAVVEAFQDFNRFREKNQWEKAFRSLTTVMDSAGKGMMPAGDGFLVPTRVSVRRALAALPADGREAYRLFNDAKAKQLWDQIVNAPAPDTNEVKTLQKIVDDFFITSVGDKAADRLGDAEMEAGDFLGADRAWSAILTDAPDTSLSKVRLLAKRGTALARAGRWEAFESVLRTVQQDYAGQTVTIAGKEVVASDYLLSLRTPASTQPATQPVVATDAPDEEVPEVSEPQSDTPAWQMQIIDTSTDAAIRNQVQQMGWMGQQGSLTDAVPATATDGKRLYVNWLGAVFALDAHTGKMLWRTNKFSDVTSQIQQFLQWSVDPERFAVVPVGDRVLVVKVDAAKLQNQEPFRLICLIADSGQQKWSSATFLAGWAFLGKPIVVGKSIYCVGHLGDNQELSLTCMNLDTGSMEWSVDLGMPSTAQNYRGMPTYQVPQLLYQGGVVYVDTNNGALLAVDAASHTLEWAYTYPTEANGLRYNPFMGGYQPATTGPPGRAIIRDGILYLKETGSSQMYALDLNGPSLKWKRGVDPDETVWLLNDRYLYLTGPEIEQFDLSDRKMNWASLRSEPTPHSPILSGRYVYSLTPRGIYEFDTIDHGDATRAPDGHLKIFRGSDRDASASVLLKTGPYLVTVSNLAVTAYALPAKSAAAAR